MILRGIDPTGPTGPGARTKLITIHLQTRFFQPKSWLAEIGSKLGRGTQNNVRPAFFRPTGIGPKIGNQVIVDPLLASVQLSSGLWKPKPFHIQGIIGGVQTQMLLDTGATANFCAERLMRRIPKVPSEPTDRVFALAQNSAIKPTGKVHLEIIMDEKRIQTPFYVVTELVADAILGCEFIYKAVERIDISRNALALRSDLEDAGASRVYAEHKCTPSTRAPGRGQAGPDPDPEQVCCDNERSTGMIASITATGTDDAVDRQYSASHTGNDVLDGPEERHSVTVGPKIAESNPNVSGKQHSVNFGPKSGDSHTNVLGK